MLLCLKKLIDKLLLLSQRHPVVYTQFSFQFREVPVYRIGGVGHAVGQMVKRTTKKLIMAKSPKGKSAKAVARFVVQMLRPFERHVLSITTDNGSEFADHKYIAKMLHTKVFFAHPYSSWEKGLIENTNKLVRQYIPKNTDFSSLSDDFILSVQTELNLRPRKLLNFDTPKYKFMLYLHNSVALRG